MEKSGKVAIEEARRFMVDCLVAAGVSEENANATADLLLYADRCGIMFHGMYRLEKCLDEIATQTTDCNAKPRLLAETDTTAWVDGCNGLGAVVGLYCMELACKKARLTGVGWVCAKGSNNYGSGGYWALMALKHGYVGITMTNTAPLMVPTRGKTAMLGANPIAMAAPAGEDDRFLMDITTTAVSIDKIERYRLRKQEIPDGWAQDSDGSVTNCPETAINALCLLPLGGTEESSGYKGYGLAAMVDLLTGVMAGASYLNKVRKESGHPANLGQLFIAVNPECFAPEFETRMRDFNTRIRNCTPLDPEKPVILPGDKEAEHMKAVDGEGFIVYVESQLKTCNELASLFNVRPLKFCRV